MDVDTALALANAAAGGAAGAAGQSAWQSLVSLVRRDRGRDAADVPDDGSGPGPERGGEQARLLYGRIVERARADEEFAGLLCRWAEQHGGALRGADHSRVNNSVPGDARVHGPVIQARDIQGGIHLH